MVETVAAEVAARLVETKNSDAARREALRIASGKRGTTQLSADLVVLVSVVVQVCAVAVGAANLIAGFVKRSKEEQIIEILRRIEENTGDSSLATDQKLKEIASVAIDVISENSTTQKTNHRNEA